MKYIVLKKFKDKYTGEKYEVNDVIEISKERAQEILVVDKLIKKVQKTQK